MSTISIGKEIHGPNLVIDGLVFYLDAANVKSYPGTGTDWNDISGNRNNVNLVNGPTFSNGSFLFNGSDEYGYCADSSNYFDFSNTSFTVSCWIKTTSLDNRIIIEKGADPSDGWGIAINSGIINPYIVSGSAFVASRTTIQTYNSGSWINISAIFTTNTTTQNLNNVSVYVNGQLDQSSLTNKRAYGGSTGYLNICHIGNQPFFLGNIASIQIHNRALSVAEILQNYGALKSRFGL